MKKRKLLKPFLISLASVLVLVTLLCVGMPSSAADETLEYSDMLGDLMDTASSFVVVYHKQLGGSHYAYTEGLAEESQGDNTHSTGEGNESVFNPGSRMTLITLTKDGDKVIKSEKTLVNSLGGVLRDPCVSSDGTKVVFSWKKDAKDDYHLYEYTFATEETTQLTFGSGVADIEPIYTGSGTIVFSSTRDIQTVDCWKTPVSNLYMCNADGTGITRLGFDQVHTTYPTMTSDGRILYTRWDYNDRNQMYVQALFQMFQDGTNQTETFGNNANNPTTLLHTREIPGETGKYISIVSGHHISQAGKLAIIDTNEGRNDSEALTYVWPDAATKQIEASKDLDAQHFQEGRVFKYPYAINENEFLVATAASYAGVDTAYDIELINTKGDSVTIAEGSTRFPASQIAPIANTAIFNRASLVNYSKNEGTYYVANVYEGEAMANVKAGTAKYLRVVGLEFRSSAIGATVASGTGSADPFSPIATGNGSWDVKKVLGIVDICEDGSALFTAPANIPLYFQILNEDGDMIQTMRSWSTLQPGEYFSCVGCHLDKNMAPTASSTVTQAMKQGVQQLRKEDWMSVSDEYDDFDPYSGDLVGFDYLNVIQPILDANCITCHSDSAAAYTKINASAMSGEDRTAADDVFTTRSDWYYTTSAPSGEWNKENFDASAWTLDYAPFGKIGTAPGQVNTVWKDTDSIWLRKTVTLTKYDIETCALVMDLAYTNAIEVYINGTLVYDSASAESAYTSVVLDNNARQACKVGENLIAVKVKGSSTGQFFDMGLRATTSAGATVNMVPLKANWTYTVANNEKITGTDWTKVGFDTTGWKTHAAPLGDRAGGTGTDWSNSNPYLWARATFTVSDLEALQGAALYLNIFYDDWAHIYINGNEVFTDVDSTAWNDGYEVFNLPSNAYSYLVEGENVLAVSLYQHTGGFELDASLYAITSVTGSTSDVGESTAVISLEGTPVLGERMRKNFPLSYLLLTGSSVNSGKQWVGKSSNAYTNYISSMSQCEVLRPNIYGSSKSTIIKRLRTGHGSLTEEQIAAVATWIDLCVPCYGTYDVSELWDGNDVREYEEELNKRELYDVLNEYAKMQRAGKFTEDDKIEVKYTTKSGAKSYETTGNGIAQLVIGKFNSGDTLTVKLPSGEKYLALSLSSRMGEALIYCPDGTFTYTVPSLTSSYPNTMNPNKGVVYPDNVIYARIVSEKELTKEHNLALNPYDLTDADGSYPHASSNNVYQTNAEWAARNAIDGFTSNDGHGTYPYQSWAPSSDISSDDYFMIDFGREVTVNELLITIRADFPHDSYFTDCTVTFSDGTTMALSLTNSAAEQSFDVGGIKTTSVKLSGFVVEKNGATTEYAALTEVACMGVENIG